MMFRFEPSTFGPVSSAPTHGARIDACPTGKLRNGKALAVNLISDILACVRALATKVQPPAISRLISLRAINAVNTAPWWTLPHVGKKVLELHPSAANRYAQTAIHVVFRVFWVRASALHHCPRVVGSTCGRVSAVAMLASVKPNAARPRAKLSPTNPHLPVRGLKRLTAFLAKNRMPYASSGHAKTPFPDLTMMQFDAADKAGGRVVRGLVNRRADEVRLCLLGLR